MFMIITVHFPFLNIINIKDKHSFMEAVVGDVDIGELTIVLLVVLVL